MARTDTLEAQVSALTAAVAALTQAMAKQGKAKPRGSRKQERNATTGTTRAERHEDYITRVKAPGCACRPFRDIRTVEAWVKAGETIAPASKGKPHTASKRTPVYCRCQLVSATKPATTRKGRKAA